MFSFCKRCGELTFNSKTDCCYMCNYMQHEVPRYVGRAPGGNRTYLIFHYLTKDKKYSVAGRIDADKSLDFYPEDVKYTKFYTSIYNCLSNTIIIVNKLLSVKLTNEDIDKYFLLK